ncbi:MAG: glycosyltransferase family 39 protein [Methylococcaceae bacterium]|nr:glycosyltransferase family 39 protein [Methylococcaceae bacterium]
MKFVVSWFRPWYRGVDPACALIWLVLVIVGLLCRPLTPIDETRVLSVAWEMWQRGDLLVPHVNGEPYSHKPPLLEWCIQLGWLAFGVHEWVGRMIPPLFGLANLALTARLARRLWPEADAVARLAPWLLLGFSLWGVWTTLTMYDMLLIFFMLVGMLGILRAARGRAISGWLIAGCAIGGGILAKGPVILLLVLPTALLAPWWLDKGEGRQWRNWYLGLLGAVALGALVALAWAIPAGQAGGEEYRKAIFWGQSAGRIAHSFAHRRPLWWYLMVSPLVFFPWILWPPTWRSLRRATLDPGLRFCLGHAAAIFLLFSLISGKQVYYLLPMFPMVALGLARLLVGGSGRIGRVDQGLIAFPLILAGVSLAFIPWAQEFLGMREVDNEALRIAVDAPWLAKLGTVAFGILLLAWSPRTPVQAARGVVLAGVAVLVSAHLVYATIDPPYYNMQPMADRLAALESQGAAIAHFQRYNGDFQFLGRLHPITVLERREDLNAWLAAHPDGHVLLLERAGDPSIEAGAEFAQYYRGTRRITLWRAATLLSDPQRLLTLAG